MKMRCARFAVLALGGALALGAALFTCAAADAAPPGPRDPDWPCQQIKVPELSLAAVWAGSPVDPQQIDWQHDQPVADLVHEIAQRREPLAQAQDKVHAFAQQAKEQKQQKLLALLAGLFSVLDQERGAVIAGLDRFGARQKELAAAIREDNEKLRQMQADSASDAGEVNQMVQRVTWEAEVFQDRRQALSYACDVPGKIEQRLFGLARAVQHDLQ
jgi:hypothetical protein